MLPTRAARSSARLATPSTWLAGLCLGQPEARPGKFANHCHKCGDCYNDAREVHCDTCGEHYHRAGDMPCYNCDPDAAEQYVGI